MGGSFIHTNGAEKYNIPKSTIIDKIAVSIQQQGSLQNQREYFVGPAKTNVMVLIPGNNRALVLQEITLVLEENPFLNEYRSLFRVL